MPKATKKQSKILKYWLTLEYLNPVQLPKEANLLKDPRMLEVARNEVGMSIYLNVFRSIDAFDFIRDKFGYEKKDENEVDAKFVTACFKLNKEGLYIEKSFQLFMLPYALNKLSKSNNKVENWNDGFKDASTIIEKWIEHDASFSSFTKITVDDIYNLCDVIKEEFNWNDQSIDVPAIYIEPIKKNVEPKPLLNSFFTNDIDKLVKNTEKYICPPTLSTYLNSALNVVSQETKDIKKDITTLKDCLQVDNYPLGSWPSKYTLSLMQQFAVNKICNELPDDEYNPIYSVNGPPGTGKTTLLLDVMAANIVKKASDQSKIKDPEKAFSEKVTLRNWKKEGPENHIYSIGKKEMAILDHGMLILSNNNEAVKNITEEIPLKSKIKGFEEEASYFSSVAEHYSDGKNWGMIAGVMGKRENVDSFLTILTDQQHGILGFLNQNKPDDLSIWRAAVSEFERIKRAIMAEKAKIKQLEVILNEKQGTDSRFHEKIREIEIDIQDPNIVYPDFWDFTSKEENQKIAPMYTKKLKELNAKLFLSALKVNEAFLLTADRSEKRVITNNLSCFAKILNGEISVDIRFPEMKQLWNQLLLVVPVVSSAFASVQSMFKNINHKSLPWVFIDEAGQAVPRSAAGALWRAEKAVVVGDPLQIEPIDTLPAIFCHFISDSYGLTQNELKNSTSVQNVTDRVTKYRTEIKNQSGAIWVGSPLTVHRRCVDTMFNIANQIAYNNSMVQATKSEEDRLDLETCFLHITGTLKGRHFIEEEGELVLNLIRREVQKNNELPDVYIISPFSEVAKALKRLLRNGMHDITPFLEKNELNDWIRKSVGTVHTFQGKEATAVIFCLGCGTKEGSGARSWAAQKPNLLNVAVTRAKNKFIVVGNKDAWLGLNYFNALKEYLSIVDANTFTTMMING